MNVTMINKIKYSDKELLNLVDYISQYSKCLSRKVGAVIVNKKKDDIISFAYNKVPSNTSDCTVCPRHNCKSGECLHICKALHAEELAILKALKSKKSLNDCILYVSCTPCYHCSKLIAQVGIRTVITKLDYDDGYNKKLQNEAHIKVTINE